MKKHIILGILIPFVYAMSQIAYADDCFESENADACYYDEPEDTVSPTVKDSQNAATTASSQKNNPPQSSPANSSSSTQTTKPSQKPTTVTQKQPTTASDTEATGSNQSTTGSGKPATEVDAEATGNGNNNSTQGQNNTPEAPSGPVQWLKGRVGNVVIIYLNQHSDYSGVQTLVFNIRPRNGQVTNNKDGTLTYTPNPDFDGVDSLTYTLTDQQGKSSTVTIKILVMKADDEDLNDIGKKAIQTAQTQPGAALDLQLSNNEDISQLILNPSENSQLRDNQDGTLTYIPNPGFSGTDQFSYTVIYLQGHRYTFIVKIDVGERDEEEMNTVVVAKPSIKFYTDHKAITYRGAIVTIDISAHYEPRKHKITVEESANSQVIVNRNATLIYMPNPSFFGGVDTFFYSVINKRSGARETFSVGVEVLKEYNIKPIPASCRIYAVHDKDVSDSQLFTIDPMGYTAKELGILYLGLDIEGMAIDPTSHLLYAISSRGMGNRLDGYLYLVNPQTGGLTVVSDTGYRELTALAFRSDGTLWAVSKGGKKGGTKQAAIIQIDPKTGKSESVFSASDFQAFPADIDGLAWSLDGSVLYATDKTTLWRFNCQKFEKVCPHVLGEKFRGKIEALETLADGMLMFAYHNNKVNTVYIFDSETCTVLLSRPFETTEHYSDVESIVWPVDCQFTQTLTNWEIAFQANAKNKVCLEKAHWIKVKGSVILEPKDTLAYMETHWNIKSPDNVTAPSHDKSADCNAILSQKSPRMITGGETPFNIWGWWPGIKGLKKGASVETHYGITLYDKERNPLGSEEIMLLGKPSICDK
ncbi:MAG: hypothetical protein DRR16_09245 [Candidatus Parabeggiatoa sp. nov. 3]|nr:MAG: hypothetical protein DRR00_15545 [Gammaproteobacteria bacterium]RKZ58092.1 MAG: hypothetical protein DRQ99_25965 [Gammaproteobacteria bacterium]RKZ86594.1 MAG: hypothetical protein DRR16_09245 [Gammaproteobacteria bacterium]HEW98369.1 tandem-95 repeat protein [Beggiatoa sp.]